MSRRTVTGAILALALVGASAGAAALLAGGGGAARVVAPTDASTGEVRDSAGRTLAAGSSRISLALDLAPAAPGAAVQGEGVLDLAQGRGRLDLDLPVGSVNALLDGGRLYVRVPGLPVGPRWGLVDLATAFPEAGSAISSLGRLVSSDPARALALLVRSADGMRRVGQETVRGTMTTHSRGTVDLGLGGPAASIGLGRLPLDAWVDGDGRLRKLAVSADPDGPGPTPTATLTLELYDFGVDVTIVPPPPGEVADLTGAVRAVAGLFR